MSSLIVPVYLNQRIVFDLIAIIEDGIATVTRLTSVEERNDQHSRELDGTFGLSEAFSSLLKISIGGKRSEGSESGSSATRNEERIHTPTSLLFKLLESLRSSGDLLNVNADYKPKPGQIIEFTTSLQRNPLLRTLDSFDGLAELWYSFAEPEQTKKKGSKQRQGAASNDEEMSRPVIKRLREQMSTFAAGVRAGDTVDIVSGDIGNGFGAVLPLHQDFLNDPTMSDLVEGEFSVLGKVVRVIETGDSGINLLRKSSLSAISEETLLPILSNFENIEGFNFPKLELEISGPVLQVIPIAVYA